MTPAVSAPCICGGSCPDETVTCLGCRMVKFLPHGQAHEFEHEHPKHAFIIHHRVSS